MIVTVAPTVTVAAIETDLIPPPPVVREHLAAHIRQGKLLRALYKLSVRAAEERHRGDIEVTNEATAHEERAAG